MDLNKKIEIIDLKIKIEKSFKEEKKYFGIKIEKVLEKNQEAYNNANFYSNQNNYDAEKMGFWLKKVEMYRLESFCLLKIVEEIKRQEANFLTEYSKLKMEWGF